MTVRLANSVILKMLAPLLEEARQKGLWFYSPYQGLWFSPDELESLQKEGRFRWGPDNWELRDPRENLAHLRTKAAIANNEAMEFAKKIGEL